MEEKDSDLPLYLKAREYMLGKIQRMMPGNNQLEPENQLTAKLGISRETVRKAMSTLIQEGIITRKHGKGNFGHPAVTNLPMRIDINSDFRRMLTSLGYSVRSVRSEASALPPSEGMLRRMPEASGSMVIRFDLEFFADGKLAIHGDVELLESIVVLMPESGEYIDNMNEFLREHCTTESNHTTAWLMAENAGLSGNLFGMKPNCALLCWEEIYYNLFDQKMGYIKIYFNPAIMDLSLLLQF
jgi:GntR family transcriptional regulator